VATVDSLEEALKLFFGKTLDASFTKTKLGFLKADGEQSLLGYLRFFLLGYFGHDVYPEEWTKHLLASSKWGRLDFVVGRTALEVAVRAEAHGKHKLLTSANRDEISKLLSYSDGKAVLALFDYADAPLEVDDLRLYREEFPLHRNAAISAYSLLHLYFDPKKGDVACRRLLIRV
jgi:hypothetical protein